MGQAGLDRGLASGVLPGAGDQYLAEDYFVDGTRLHAGLLEDLANHRGAQVGSGDRAQGTLEAADGGTGSGDNHNIIHGDTSAANTIKGGGGCPGE
ncbi:hypothetical protein D3C80_1110390 [compost metagenome]